MTRLKRLEITYILLLEAPVETKIKMLGSMFPEKIEFDGTKYRTDSYNSVLTLIYQNANILERQKKKNRNLPKEIPIQYPEPGSNRHGMPHWCLRPARLPIPPSGLITVQRYGKKSFAPNICSGFALRGGFFVRWAAFSLGAGSVFFARGAGRFVGFICRSICYTSCFGLFLGKGGAACREKTLP